MDNILIIIFQLAILIFSVMIHEVSHGYMADYLGDPTARLAGRLTLNPMKHLDWFGSVFLPLTFYFLSGGNFIFGWAKPVPYNPLNLKNPRRDSALVAIAGPAANFALAIVFGLSIRLLGIFPDVYAESLAVSFSLIAYVNILLGVFNLIPIAPLDGSKVLYSLLPNNQSSREFILFMEQYGIFFLLVFVFFGFQLIVPVIEFIFHLLSGVYF